MKDCRNCRFNYVNGVDGDVCVCNNKRRELGFPLGWCDKGERFQPVLRPGDIWKSKIGSGWCNYHLVKGIKGNNVKSQATGNLEAFYDSITLSNDINLLKWKDDVNDIFHEFVKNIYDTPETSEDPPAVGDVLHCEDRNLYWKILKVNKFDSYEVSYGYSSMDKLSLSESRDKIIYHNVQKKDLKLIKANKKSNFSGLNDYPEIQKGDKKMANATIKKLLGKRKLTAQTLENVENYFAKDVEKLGNLTGILLGSTQIDNIVKEADRLHAEAEAEKEKN
jgi:hypothetical protein